MTIPQIRTIFRFSPCHQRDVSRSSRNVVRVAMAAAGVRCLHPAKRRQRTVKSCGPGAATLALPAGACFRTTGARKAASPGRARISRQTIARGKPGCLGCTCQSRVRSFYPLHTVLRARSAPGFSRALFPRGSNEDAKLRRKSRREDENARLSTVIASEAKQSSFRRRGKKAGLLRRYRSSQ